MPDNSKNGNLESGYYWVRDRGNPLMVVREWAPDCGCHGMWFMVGVDGGVDPDLVEVCSGRINEPKIPATDDTRPWWRRMFCWGQCLCRHYEDAGGVGGQCIRCGMITGYVTRSQLHAYTKMEYGNANR